MGIMDISCFLLAIFLLAHLAKGKVNSFSQTVTRSIHAFIASRLMRNIIPANFDSNLPSSFRGNDQMDNGTEIVRYK
jgi:hypothetical protein